MSSSRKSGGWTEGRAGGKSRPCRNAQRKNERVCRVSNGAGEG